MTDEASTGTFRTSDGVRLSYLREGAGEPVLLVGGYGAPKAMWGLQREALVTAGFTVVSVDRRHHADSDFPAHGQRMARHGADLHELIGGLGLGPVHAVGSSMGASALFAMVDLFGTPDVRSVTAIDQTPKMIAEPGWDLGLYGLTWEGLDAWVRAFPGDLNPFHAAPPPAAMPVLQAVAAGPPHPHDATRSLLRDHAVQDWRDVVERVDVPLLAVGGRHSPLWPVAGQEWIAAHAPHGRLAILEDSGHAPFLSEPETFNDVLIAFLREV